MCGKRKGDPMKLDELISRRMLNDQRLRGVPAAVIEEIVTGVFSAVENEVAGSMTVDQLLGEWEQCESCIAFGLSDAMAHDPEENIAFCRQCVDEMKAAV
jgi:hypothetical protein